MGMNVVLGALAFRDLLRLQPKMYSGASSWSREVEEYLFIPSETAPVLVVLLSFWLVFRRRQALFSLPRESGPGWLAALSLVIGLLIFAWSHYTNAPDLQVFSLIATVIGGAILWRGTAAVRILRVPLILLLFAVPLPSPLLGQLVWSFQSGTAELSGFYLGLLGIPVLVSTHIIQISGQTFQVIEGCSGLRSVETLAMLSILMVDLFDRRGWHAACLIGASLPVAFLMNSLRVLTLILNPHSAIQSIHTVQGILILMAALIVLYLLDGVLSRISAPSRPSHPPAASSPPPALDESAGDRPSIAVTACLVAMLLATFFLPRWDPVANRKGFVLLSEAVSRDIEGWSSEDLPRPNETIRSIAISQVLNRRYTPEAGAPSVDVFVGIGNHLDRFRSTFSPKTAFPSRGWIVEDEGVRTLHDPDREVPWTLLRSGTRRVVVYHWYEENRGLGAESMRSLLALDRSPFQRDLATLTVRLAAELPERTPESLALVHARMEKLYHQIAREIEAIKRMMKGDAADLVMGPSVCPLWESFFHSSPWRQNTKTSKISELRPESSMA